MKRTPPKSLSISDPNLNITKRCNSKRVRLEEDCEFDKNEQFKSEILEMLSNIIAPINIKLESLEKSILDIKRQNTDIKATNSEVEKSLHFLSGQIKDFEQKILNLENERKANKLKILELEDRHEVIERTLRKTCIEIRGVTKVKNENKLGMLKMVSTLRKNISSETSQNEIRDVYRLPSKATAATSTVVVEFMNFFLKEDFLQSTKRYNNSHTTSRLTTKHLGLEDNALPLYFSEHLTSKARRLYFLSRDFAHKEEYQFCWVANGRIFLRKKEGANYIIVKNEDTLQQLRDTPKNEGRSVHI